MGAFVPVLRPREIPRRGRGPFLVSGARGGKNEIIFPGDMRGGKNTSHGAKCEKGPAPVGVGPFLRQSGARGPSGYAGGASAIVPLCGTGQGEFKGETASPL